MINVPFEIERRKSHNDNQSFIALTSSGIIHYRTEYQ